MTEARRLLEDSLEQRRALGDQRGVADTLRGLADLWREEGNCAATAASLAESLRMYSVLGDKANVERTLEEMAFLAAELGQTERAARLWGAAERLWEELDLSRSPNAQEEHEKSVSAARATLGEEVFTSAWEDGRAMTLEQGITYALADA